MSDPPKLRLLPTGPSPPSENVVAHLRDLLAKAERGEVVSLATAWEYRDGGMAFHAVFTPGAWPVKLVGELEVLKHELLKTRAGVVDRS